MSRKLPPLNALRAFEAAGRHLSFTRGAGELNVTQAAVSQQVKLLEEHVGRRLIAEEPNRLPAYTVEMDILQNLKRIYYFAKRMARAAVPAVPLREAS